MTTAWSNEETFKFIELYQNQPVIWNPKHKYHKDKNKVEEEGADEIPDMQQSTQGQESSTTVSIPVQKRRSTKLPELAETNAKIKSTLSTLNDILTVKRNRCGKVEEDDCDLYGRLLAKALREFSAIDRLELRLK
ncbi:unnamed protein product [Parnassius apollo]|uniref:(apollo) hypothetical protein n=1 Tax=Parnassius apollo TaxID=110799 RepID=A0A8S3XSA1_PARAO|nr:unnamed protein product [Parnassius apollo]